MLLIFTPLMLYYPETLPGLLVALAGFIMLLPRHFIRLAEKETFEEKRISRVPLQLLALPIAVICLLLAQTLIPDQTRSWRVPAIILPLNDIGDLIRMPFGQSEHTSLLISVSAAIRQPAHGWAVRLFYLKTGSC